jgi:hypothetical protein
MTKIFTTESITNPQIKATLITWINAKDAGESDLINAINAVGQSEVHAVAKPEGAPNGYRDAKWRKCAHIAIKNINGIDREIRMIAAFYAPDLVDMVDSGAAVALSTLAINAIEGVANGNADRASVHVAQQADIAITGRDHNLSEVWSQWSDVIKYGCKGKIAKASQGLARAGQQVAVNRRKLGDLGVKGFINDATPETVANKPAKAAETKPATVTKNGRVQQVQA